MMHPNFELDYIVKDKRNNREFTIQYCIAKIKNTVQSFYYSDKKIGGELISEADLELVKSVNFFEGLV